MGSGRQEERWGHSPAVKGEACGRSGQAIPAAQTNTLYMGFLPSDCTVAIA